jgi:hypothetical protein
MITNLFADGRRVELVYEGKLPDPNPLHNFALSEGAYLRWVRMQCDIPGGYVKIVPVLLLYSDEAGQLIVHDEDKLPRIDLPFNMQASALYYEAYRRQHHLPSAKGLGQKRFFDFVNQTGGAIVGDSVLLLTGEHKLT